jgi:DNA end-binding protein Ku
MEEAGVGAIGRFVRSGRESVCLVRTRGRGLVLETLYLAEDVYSQAEIDEAMEGTELKETELDLARQIVEGLAADFEPEALTSEYRSDLRALLEAKLRGEEITVPEPAEEPAPTVDLIEALKASVAAAKVSTDRKKPAAKPKAERRPARKAARK